MYKKKKNAQGTVLLISRHEKLYYRVFNVI